MNHRQVGIRQVAPDEPCPTGDEYPLSSQPQASLSRLWAHADRQVPATRLYELLGQV